MSADDPRQEAKSSVSITTTAQGKPLVAVKVYSGDLNELNEIREAAVEQYKLANREVGLPV